MKIDLTKIQVINQTATLEASKALSLFIGLPVMIGTVLLEVQKVGSLFSLLPPKEQAVSIHIPVTGDAKGFSMLLMLQPTALKILDILFKRNKATTQTITPQDEEALIELGNIVVGNYLKTFATAFLNTTLLHGLGHFYSGEYQTILSQITPSALPSDAEELIIEITFGFPNKTFKSFVIFVFSGVNWEKEFGRL